MQTLNGFIREQRNAVKRGDRFANYLVAILAVVILLWWA